MIFIDRMNIDISLKNILNIRGMHIDYAELADIASEGREVVKKIIFDSYSSENDWKLIALRDLESKGFELNLREDRYQQKEVDMALGTEMCIEAMSDHYDTAILFSGDRDFVPAVENVRKLGKKVEVFAFYDSLSSDLILASDLFALVDELPVIDAQKYLLRRRQTYCITADADDGTLAEAI